MNLGFPRHRLAIAAAVAMAATAAVITTSGTAMANVSNCVNHNTGYQSDTVLVCGAMNGTGLHVNSALSNAGVFHGDKKSYILQACLHGPQGGIVCTPFSTIAPGGEIEADWYPNATEPAGEYCSNIWVESSYSGPDSLLGQVCWSVHP